MLSRITVILGQTIIILLIFYSALVSAQTGTLKGTIQDAKTGDPLPYSNVILLETSFGGSADKEGNYVIKGIPSGSYTIRVTYIGYRQVETTTEIIAGKTTEYSISLELEAIEGETVVVTGQAEGQLRAINEQLNSLQIKNVVSLSKILELPDANAAESVSRLPGVSLIRTGGEGSQVVIRGLSPQYNQITIDGVELPSDVASFNNLVSSDKGQQGGGGTNSGFSIADLGKLGDRGTDLSMISSNSLGGIEVIKAITPDMDATLIGGVVNFGLRKATKSYPNRILGEPSFPFIQITSQGSYNDLKDSYGDYKFVGTAESRFFDGSFGVFVQGLIDKRNLSSNELRADYDLQYKTHGDAGVPDLVSLDLTDVFRERERSNITAVLDYEYQSGEIDFMNFFSTSDTKATSRSESILQASNDLYYSAKDEHNKLNVISNLLILKQDIPIFHVDLKLSHSYSESKNPRDLFFNFWQDDAGLSNRGNLAKVPPGLLASYIVPNDSIASLDQIQTKETFTKERVATGSLDLQTSLPISNDVTAIIKFGGMFQYRYRSNDINEYQGSHLYSGGGGVINAFSRAYPDLILNGGNLSFLNFSHDSYSYGDFLNGDYNLAYPINVELMYQLLPIARQTSTLEGYQINHLASMLNDYSGNEKKSAAYLMATLNIGDKITVVPGARYQNLTTTFTAVRGETPPGPVGINGGEVTKTESHGFLLPMVHVRYRPLDWLQVQFAYTNTLNYPDYSVITPRFFVGTGFISYNNYQLKPATSENFDLVVSAFANELGLFTIDGFKKRIKDLIFASETYVTDLSPYPELPQDRKQLFQFNTYINNPIPIDVYGIETEWQTNFWYLPQPFSGIVFNINYTHIFSEASYPKSELINEYDEQGNLVQTVNDTSYTTRLLNQPNDILNLSVGYDFGGFSARLSLLYQDNIFKKPDFWMQNRVNSDQYTRWDLSVKQTLPWYGIQLYFNLNNISGERDIDVNQKTSFPAAEEHYGMTADMGLRLTL